MPLEAAWSRRAGSTRGPVDVNQRGHLGGLHDQPNLIRETFQMMDVILLALIGVLFAVSVGYAYACERL